MTRDEILNMPAGREMDALVAEKVMGWTNPRITPSGRFRITPPMGGKYHGGQMPPKYSTDIAAAWQVVEWLMERGDVFVEYWSDGEWFVADKPVGVRQDATTAMCDGKATGEMSAPLAICRAALLAVMPI